MYTEAIKKAARISHNLLDDELERLETYACMEMVRAGVPVSQITEDNELIRNAVVTRALMDIGPEKSREFAKESWEYQLDVLRKHIWTEANADV